MSFYIIKNIGETNKSSLAQCRPSLFRCHSIDTEYLPCFFLVVFGAHHGSGDVFSKLRYIACINRNLLDCDDTLNGILTGILNGFHDLEEKRLVH